MTIIDNRDKIVLVTGISGSTASQLGLQMLQKGYTVRGTSRSSAAKDHLLAGAFKDYDAQYEHAEVQDITAKGAFDEQVKSLYGSELRKSVFDAIFGGGPGTLLHFRGQLPDRQVNIPEDQLRPLGNEEMSYVVTCEP